MWQIAGVSIELPEQRGRMNEVDQAIFAAGKTKAAVDAVEGVHFVRLE